MAASSYLAEFSLLLLMIPVMLILKPANTQTTNKTSSKGNAPKMLSAISSPTASRPPITPPEESAWPCRNRSFTTFFSSKSPTTGSAKNRLPMAAKRTGSKKIAVTRRANGLPLWKARIAAATRKAGAESQ